MGGLSSFKSGRAWLATLAVGTLASLPAFSSAALVLVDFGVNGRLTTTDGSGRQWNNYDADTHPTTSQNLLTSTNTASGIAMNVGNGGFATTKVGFNGSNANNLTTVNSPTGAALAHGYPFTAVNDSGYGNSAGAAFNGGNVTGTRVTLSGLDPTLTYNFDLFASRGTDATDNRETQYTINGGTGGTAATTLLLQPVGNTGNIVSAGGFRPDAAGSITIDVTAGPGNTQANKFYYLGVLEINSVPEPTSLAAVGVGAAALLTRRRRA